MTVPLDLREQLARGGQHRRPTRVLHGRAKSRRRRHSILDMLSVAVLFAFVGTIVLAGLGVVGWFLWRALESAARALAVGW